MSSQARRGGTGGAPSGPAGGDLAGMYPDPTVPAAPTTFADAAARAAATPTQAGQIGVQLDDGSLWRANSVTTGDWSKYVTILQGPTWTFDDSLTPTPAIGFFSSGDGNLYFNNTCLNVGDLTYLFNYDQPPSSFSLILTPITNPGASVVVILAPGSAAGGVSTCVIIAGGAGLAAGDYAVAQGRIETDVATMISNAIAALKADPTAFAAFLAAASIVPVADGTVTPLTSGSTNTGVLTALS